MFFGGVRRIFGGTKQLIHGIQDIRDDIKADIAKEKDEKRRKTLEETLAKMDQKLGEHQDEVTKKLVKQIKEKHLMKKKNGQSVSEGTEQSS